MIRLVTFRNFPLVDLQIERVYRRRCKTRRRIYASVDAVDDEELLCMVREARRQSRCDGDWMRQLAKEVDALTTKVRTRTHDRRRGARGRNDGATSTGRRRRPTPD